MSHTPSRCLAHCLQSQALFIVMFQSFVMGADALAELESPLAEVDPGLQRTGRQFSFNDLNFEGFQGGATSQQSPFQSFPQFTSPASTSTTFARARQPIPSRCQPFNINQTQKNEQKHIFRMQTPVPSLQSPSLPRGRRIRPPPNADPRFPFKIASLPALLCFSYFSLWFSL